MPKQQKKFNFEDNFKKMFTSTESSKQNILNEITNIEIEKLVPFANHPFKLYEGERFEDMIESIKENGIIMPVIVRPLDNETYEILSGHNRVEAAKHIGFEAIPSIIREGLSNDEALLIVTETNLIQRSFADLSHSERAAALTVHHEAFKNQGKRTDLINDIENLLKIDGNPSNSANNLTSAHIGRKLETREKVGQQYGLSKNSVARYLRINTLITQLKQSVDESKIPFLAAVELSYVSGQEQSDLFDVLSKNPNLKIDIKKAEFLREFSESNKLTQKMIEDILSGIAFKKKNRPSLPVQSLKIGGKMLSKYFKPEQNPEDIKAELFEALEFYRAHKNTTPD